MNYPRKIAIVIVNWNKKECIINLMNSISRLKFSEKDIFIVDNASTDDSVKTISKLFPHSHLIINSENLGGTGGFNTGLRKVLNDGSYKYAWLLDNDVAVNDSTLDQLTKILESDKSIGIAGSRIIDEENHEITVALGGILKRDSIGVVPNFRNVKSLVTSDIVDADYTAICSALVRISAVNKVGLMDERFFLFWDDIDWGLLFKKYGYRVVAVPQSIVYHPNFTEKYRGHVTTYYYGIRNPLLVYSKHAKDLRRFIVFYKNLRYLFKGIIFLYFNKHYISAHISLNAIKDFCINKWGKMNYSYNNKINITQRKINPFNKSNFQKILIIGSDSRHDNFKLKKKLISLSPNSEITLFITDDRKDIYATEFDHLLVIDQNKKEKISYVLRLILKIFFSRYDISITTQTSTDLFSYGVRKTYLYTPDEDSFSESNINTNNIYKLFLSFILGELISIVVLPIVYLCSFRYKNNA